MSFLLTWIAYLRSRGMTLTESRGLPVVMPASRVTPGDLSVLRTHKEALLALLELWEERAAIMQYDGRLPRAEAERLAWEALGVAPPAQKEAAA